MKYHCVLNAPAEIAGKLLLRCPDARRGDGGLIRRFPGEHMWVTNFRGSEDIASYRKQIVWDTQDGVMVGLIKGLAL